MLLKNKNTVVIGGSRDLGRTIVKAFLDESANVLAVARHEESLAALSVDLPGVQTLAIDATEEDAPEKVFKSLNPDILIVCGGARIKSGSLQNLSWNDFSVNWDVDVKMSFLFCKAALTLPLKAGSTIVLVSSGAGLGGSPISGGYAGAKRTQMFMANYAQREASRLNLGLRFMALVPMRPMPETERGQGAVKGYAQYLGISEEESLKGMEPLLTTQDVARALVELTVEQYSREGSIFTVSGKDVERLDP